MAAGLSAALRRRLPPGLRRSLRRAALLPFDLADAARGRRPPLVPPRGLQDHGAGDFVATGLEFLELFRALGGLGPQQRVLDVGCGIGRMAVALTGFLGASGSYDGFDVSRRDIAWCTRTITARHPRFRFRWVDVANREYNRGGELSAARCVFPYAEAAFDFVFATSVFTHLLADGAARYLAEVSRVLRPGGTCFATYFLLNGESRRLIGEGRSELRFAVPCGEAFVHDRRRPESIVAYDEAMLRALYGGVGLRPNAPIRYGAWCGREPFTSYQDVVIAEKAG